jgi:DNA-binding NarL/FixJ family response regulator
MRLSPSIRVAIIGLPRQLREIIARAVVAQADMEVAGEWPTSASLLSAVEHDRPDVVVVGAEQHEPEDVRRIVERHGTRILTLVAGGRRAVLYGPSASEETIAEITPSELVTAIRKMTSPNRTLAPGAAQGTRREQLSQSKGELGMAAVVTPEAAVAAEHVISATIGPCQCRTPFGKDSPFFTCHIGGEVRDASGRPNTILPNDQRWYVDVNAELQGSLVRTFCGYLCFCIYLDPCGDCRSPIGNPCYDIELNPCGTGKYEYTFEFPAPNLEARDCACLFNLCLSTTYKDSCPERRPGGLLVGDCKGPFLEFFVPGGITP